MYKVSSRQKLWTSFVSIRPKIWSLEQTHIFLKAWPSDLVFDPTWPIFKLVRDFMKTNILTNFHDNQTENMASRMYTRFFKRFDLVFYTKWPIFKHDQDFINKNILTKFHDNWTENLATRAYTRFFLRFELVTYFLTWHEPFSSSSEISSRQTFWLPFMIIGLKMWTLESTQAKKFQRGKILKLACFVPMFHFVTLWVEPILTPRASYE